MDQYLNIKLDDISVVEELRYPHLVRATLLQGDGVGEVMGGRGRVRGELWTSDFQTTELVSPKLVP